MPARQEAAERRLLGRLHLLAERRERRAAQAPQDVGIAPLALGAAGAKLAADESLLALELAQHRLDVDAEVVVRLRGRERPATLGEAGDEALERVRPALEERLGQPAGRHRAERVPVAACVLGGDEALLARDPQRDRAALVEQRPGERRDRTGPAEGLPASRRTSWSSSGLRGSRRSWRLDLLERARIDQVAQLLLAEQLLAAGRGRARAPARAAPPAACRPRTCSSRRSRRAARSSRARRVGGLDVDEVELPRLQARQQPLQRRQVEHVLQALAVGLEDDRERAVLAGDLEQALRLQPLLPERRPLAGTPARDQQRAARVLAEAGAEQGAAAELAHHELLDLGRDR